MTINEVLSNWESIGTTQEPIAYAFYNILDNYKRNSNYRDCQTIVRTFFRSVNNDALYAFDTLEKHLDNTMEMYVKKTHALFFSINSSVGERPAPRGGTTRPDERKITII